ncbi:accessory factor UbiK family protein [Alphaproteobacteria bacterium]|nr:accessory factor UbiK family protein [Alphaproteobacteria bacterium]
MRNTKFFFKDTASLVSGALSTFSGLKNEIDNIIKSRFEKIINVQGIVSREDFEALVDRHEKLNAEFNLFKVKTEKKVSKSKDKRKK